MKKTIIVANLILAVFGVKAQIKVWPNGSSVMGSTTSSSLTGHKLQVVGKTVFTSGTGTVTAAPYIVGTNTWTTASSPDYTWKGDSTTGIFHPNFGNLSVTTGGTERMRFTGIGFTNSYATGFAFASTATTSITSCASISGTNTWGAANTPEYTWYNDPDCGMFHPSADNIAFATNGTERMRLTANALLLGTSSDPTNVRLYIAAAASNQALYSTTTYTANYGYHQINNVDNSTTKAIVVQLSGTDKYVVSGSGDVWEKSHTDWSDKTLKENFDTIHDALSKIRQLYGFKYNFKQSVTGQTNNKTEIGLLAQDVEQIVPEVVNTNDNGIKGIMYGNIVALLVEGIVTPPKTRTV